MWCPRNLMHNHKHVCARTLTHSHTDSWKGDKLRVPPVNQCVGMATQLGGNARQKAAPERKECTILVFCLCQGDQETDLMSERGEAGARYARVCHQGCSAEIKSYSVERKCSDAQLWTGSISHDPKCAIKEAEDEKYGFAVPHLSVTSSS